jgi:hypothetical protein
VAIAPTGIAVAIETKTERSTVAISLGCANRRRGCHAAGEDVRATAPLA